METTGHKDFKAGKELMAHKGFKDFKELEFKVHKVLVEYKDFKALLVSKALSASVCKVFKALVEPKDFKA